MAEQELSKWRLESRQYLGEISALCFLHLPPQLCSLPFILAGTGSQILLYSMEAGKLLNSFNVFEGIRVHGISCSIHDSTEDGPSSRLAFNIAVFGEKRIKLFNLFIQIASVEQCQSELILIHVMPKFSHWILDICFLKDSMLSQHGGDSHLAIGLGDNSICIWDIANSNVVLEVKCPERCLLYSMRLWGSKLDALHVACGTIYNEIIVWKVVPQNNVPPSRRSIKDPNGLCGSFCNNVQLHDRQYEAIYLHRLTGHEGSIFHIAWSSDGSKLISVSDDRSARVWTLNAERKDSTGTRGVGDPTSTDLSLFGHNARVWDCHISDSLIVTAGEDCSCRVWGIDGSQLKVIKEHTGRGIWRCLYDEDSSLLVTAGFDSAIKVHQVHTSLSRSSVEQTWKVKEFRDMTNVFTICTPKLSEKLGLMDSKSEYVRCLRFTREDTLYIATNHGLLYHVNISDPGDVKWTELVRVSEEVPIVCMDLLSISSSDFSRDDEDWIAVGDGKGNATVVRVSDGVCTDSGPSFTWTAGLERQLLGIYWCKSLGCSHIFTADPRGILKLWRIFDPLQSCTNRSIQNYEASLVAEFTSCFGARIMCLDASFDEEVLVCGDQRGNLTVFPLSKNLLQATSIAPGVKIPPLNYFKGAHGISSIASISIAQFCVNQVDIRSTGADGCVCYFKYDSDWKSLEFTGMKQVKELSLIHSVSSDANTDEDLACGNYAIGFASADFIMWNLTNETKVVEIPCGGWRRPYSYYLGDAPDIQNCFAFVKDHAVHIHRLWVPASEKKSIPRVLHMQNHGREIHSLCFVSEGTQFADRSSNHFTRSSWIATGSEDGSVRLTRYSSETKGWSTSKLLGEHVGGSAVRSICFVSKTHTTLEYKSYISNDKNGNKVMPDNRDNQLLISVGAKRVLTSWLLRNRRLGNKEETFGDPPINSFTPSNNNSSMSFQWLSTDMPSKFSSTRKRVENTYKMTTNSKYRSHTEDGKMELECKVSEKNEDDWRYLAVTAFLVKGTDCRLTVCFVVVSCSDATLVLRALLLPYRLWFDVALLVPLSSPVLSLQHAVIPIYAPPKEKVIDCQKRPRTGRGSQGGRWWRSLSNQPSKAKKRVTVDVNKRGDTNGHLVDSEGCGSSSDLSNPNKCTIDYPQTIDPANSSESDMHTDKSPFEICEVHPLHVLKHIHQSGVNCIHVSNIRDWRDDRFGYVYYVLSGGDDQAVHCLTFDLVLQPTSHDAENKKVDDTANQTAELCDMGKSSLYGEKEYGLRLLYHERIASAHSSAVKGVWTDGIWAFSTGLDQRVRCWHVEEHGELTEHSHLIISVPEPETIDARACGSNRYWIAVGGRGIQMVEFYSSGDGDKERNDPHLYI
ncbi:PREDICTED: uncharacterized protein LOC104607119 isoform X2 [Nelumbo nucifera]|uniref:Uncharacterized protein LOC104607119 isoform X2 n=1 Tax=Nelumbo nucifera TaxID=4432 RepID=A0A1U8ASL0_NELNU|nr:PREDICTED: uncharacterized protein LOC104607119 isoform X2 [Nelumbo nucifera]